MTRIPPIVFISGVAAPLAAVALTLALGPSAAEAAAIGVMIGYGATPYTVSATCNLSQPIVELNVVVQNRGNLPSAAQSLEAVDQSGVLRGTAPLPPLAPGGAPYAVSIPMVSPGKNPAAIGGPHTVMVSAGERRSQPLLVQIPPALCAAPPSPAPPAAPTVAPAAKSAPVAGGTPAPGTISAIQRTQPRIVVATPAPKPVLVQNASNQRAAVLAASLAVGVPNNLHAANGAPDCAVHVGLLGALVCPDMVKNGGLLLVWDWQAGPGPGAIDGYRVYRVDGGLKQLVDTVHNKQSQTLSNVPKPSGGYVGKCYAATAFAGARESALSQPFCTANGAVATTTRLPLFRVRSSAKQRDNTMFKSDPNSGLIVGFDYSKEEHLLGDDYHNYIYRIAVGFDVSPLFNRRLVAAKLHLPVVTTAGSYGNHACATDVGTGTGAWWQNHDWLEGDFHYNIAPTDMSPEITADVTRIVAPWLSGEPNYGFVVKNEDENLGAFINKRCMTTFRDPVLEITYY
ncbi:MAG: hypothetical protein QOJ39_1633 [Candidatus Eremiobacteraeota bacterium]|jgi:hypothetical protein|nr:hypothetical protein [Candidatus Eremiobacteraeota bacterium]